MRTFVPLDKENIRPKQITARGVKYHQSVYPSKTFIRKIAKLTNHLLEDEDEVEALRRIIEGEHTIPKDELERMRVSLTGISLPQQSFHFIDIAETADDLPEVLEINLGDLSLPPPTHILIVSTAKAPFHDPLVVPTHLSVLHSNCQAIADDIASWPIPEPINPTEENKTIELPLVDFNIPSKYTFRIIHRFLYTHSTDELYLTLLPPSKFPPYAIRTNPVNVACHYCDTQSVERLSKLSRKIWKLWENADAMEIKSREFFVALDRCWFVVVVGLKMRLGIMKKWDAPVFGQRD